MVIEYDNGSLTLVTLQEHSVRRLGIYREEELILESYPPPSLPLEMETR